jgi:hypothetical protein
MTRILSLSALSSILCPAESFIILRSIRLRVEYILNLLLPISFSSLSLQHQFQIDTTQFQEQGDSHQQKQKQERQSPFSGKDLTGSFSNKQKQQPQAEMNSKTEMNSISEESVYDAGRRRVQEMMVKDFGHLIKHGKLCANTGTKYIRCGHKVEGYLMSEPECFGCATREVGESCGGQYLIENSTDLCDQCFKAKHGVEKVHEGKTENSAADREETEQERLARESKKINEDFDRERS